MELTQNGLWEALLRGPGQGVLHHWTDDGFEHTPWHTVVADAHGMAATLRAAGVRPGTRVAAVLTNSADTVRGLLAVWLAGGAVASLPLPSRGQSPDEYGKQLGLLLDRLDPAVLMLDERFTAFVPADLWARLPVLGWSSLRGSGRIDPCPPGPDETAFIQFSSGSTSLPKGCMLTTRAIAAQLDMILAMTRGRPGTEIISSWLPLSHDMGVFGTLLYAWAFDFDLVLSSPERFGMAPRSWFRDMAEYGATMTAGTNTAVHLAVRAQGRTRLSRPLALRTCVIGAERVDWPVLQAATEAFGPSGLSPTAFMPAYGMAEATLAVSATPVDALPSVRAFDEEALFEGKVLETSADAPGAVRLVSNGPPLPGVGVTTRRPGEVSELLVASPSLATGYYGDPERTAQRFREGRLHTGDLGFTHDGEVFFVGRADDLISVGGRKIYTGEIESAVEALGQVRMGGSALVDVPGAGGSELVLFLEPRRRNADFAAIADSAAAQARARSGIALSECVFLEPGSMPRTPSGKVQRFRCRALLGRDEHKMRAVARVRLG